MTVSLSFWDSYGYHIPIKCSGGGLEVNKEHYNFKIFYSVVLMAMVDFQYGYVWASCGCPGNSHDIILFQSTNLNLRNRRKLHHNSNRSKRK